MYRPKLDKCVAYTSTRRLTRAYFNPTTYLKTQSYLVITPLTSLDGQRTVLVNRGWVPLSWKERPEERVVGEPAGQVGTDNLLPGMRARRRRLWF